MFANVYDVALGFGKVLLMHANVSLKAALLSLGKLFNFTSQLIYHSFEKKVRVVTILYDIKKNSHLCIIGLLLWGSSCLFRFLNLPHLFKRQQNSTWLITFLSEFIIFFIWKELLVSKQERIRCYHCVKKPIFYGIFGSKKT